MSKFVSYLSNSQERMIDFKINIKIPWSWFRVFQITSKVWVLEQSQSTILCLITLLTKLSDVFCNMNIWRSLINRLSYTWVHYKTARVSLLTDHKISGRPFMSGTSTSWQIVSIPLIQVPLSWIDDHPSRNLKLLCNYSTFLLINSLYLSTYFWACPSIS